MYIKTYPPTLRWSSVLEHYNLATSNQSIQSNHCNPITGFGSNCKAVRICVFEENPCFIKENYDSRAQGWRAGEESGGGFSER